ncbi:MAG: DUF72 domain-containing protein [Chloroflexota bacterium]
MSVWIGTSGWQYRDWRAAYYPPKLPPGRWLEAYAADFATVESNNAFYRLPGRRTFEAWAERTPEDFVMAVKVSRYLTHILRLTEPDEPVDRFLDRARGLGSKLGPVLVQLPPTLRRDVGRLEATLDRFGSGVRVAVEFRHETWFVDEVRRTLERHGAALCLADRRGMLTPVWRTADWTYLRFHEGRAEPRPCYGRSSLATWAARLADVWGPDADAWVYFNNDPRACAPRDAARFAAATRHAGLQPTRTSRPSAVHVRTAT